MKVLIEGKIYDSENTPIAIQLSGSDFENVRTMHPDANVYVCFPDKMDPIKRDSFFAAAKELKNL